MALSDFTRPANVADRVRFFVSHAAGHVAASNDQRRTRERTKRAANSAAPLTHEGNQNARQPDGQRIRCHDRGAGLLDDIATRQSFDPVVVFDRA